MWLELGHPEIKWTQLYPLTSEDPLIKYKHTPKKKPGYNEEYYNSGTSVRFVLNIKRIKSHFVVTTSRNYRH